MHVGRKYILMCTSLSKRGPAIGRLLKGKHGLLNIAIVVTTTAVTTVSPTFPERFTQRMWTLRYFHVALSVLHTLSIPKMKKKCQTKRKLAR